MSARGTDDMPVPGTRRLAGTALAAVLAVVGLSGCAGGPDEGAQAPYLEGEVPDVRGEDDLDDVYRGVLDARFVEDLPAYDMHEVTVLATVADVLSPRTFTVTSPGDAEVGPVLVVTSGEAAEVDPRAGDELVLAATPVGEFDAGVVGEELGLALEDERYEEWDGEMFLVATIAEASR